MTYLVGASGRSGRAVAQALRTRGIPFTPVVRNLARWSGQERPCIADLTSRSSVAEALADAKIVISCAHARHIPAILASAPAARRFVFLGSTRKFTRWPDDHGNGVLAGEAAFENSGRSGVLLHPTMIYGATGEDNVQRLAALLQRLPVVPLPGGGRALVQPIHQSDVTRAILAALEHDWTTPESIVVAGPTALPYADFVRAVALAAGLAPPRLVPIPAALLLAATPFTRLPGVPRVRPAEIRRLLEDKSFDITPMRAKLGIDPIPLAEGLAATFKRNPPCP